MYFMSCTRIRDSTDYIVIEKTNQTSMAQELVSGQFHRRQWLMEQHRTVQGRNNAWSRQVLDGFFLLLHLHLHGLGLLLGLGDRFWFRFCFSLGGRFFFRLQNVYVKYIYAYRCICTFNSHKYTGSIIHV